MASRTESGGRVTEDELLRQRVADLGRVLEAEKPLPPVELLPADPDAAAWLEHAVGSLEVRPLCACGCGLTAPKSAKSGGSKTLVQRRYVRGHYRRTHGATFTPEWRAYHHAKNRCRNPKNQNFVDYGGRGIEFRFVSVEHFLRVLGPRPSSEHSLDRIDVNGHYEPGNVRWSTPTEQANNRRPRRTEEENVAEFG